MSLELALLTPALLVLTLAGIQLALWMHARHVALAAAQAGARAESAYASAPGDGETAARTYAASLGRTLLLDVQVSAQRTATVASVEVRGRAIRIIALIPLSVTETAQRTREQLP